MMCGAAPMLQGIPPIELCRYGIMVRISHSSMHTRYLRISTKIKRFSIFKRCGT
jgi:hypothetical protein